MSQKCSYCSSSKAIVFCQADSAYLCAKCDLSIHSANKLSRRHVRQPVNTAQHASSSSPANIGSGVSPSSSADAFMETSDGLNGKQSDWNPLSLEMIANACVRREAEALSESSGFVVPPTYLRSKYSVGSKLKHSQQHHSVDPSKKSSKQQHHKSKRKDQSNSSSAATTTTSTPVRYNHHKHSSTAPSSSKSSGSSVNSSRTK